MTIVKSKNTGFKSIDDYLSTLPEDSRRIMEQIRAAVKSLAPAAREKISYQMPAFELNGRNLIHFAAWKRHFSIYPIPAGDRAFKAQVSKYADGKGTLKFPLDEPVPMKLIHKIIKLHRVQNSKMIHG